MPFVTGSSKGQQQRSAIDCCLLPIQKATKRAMPRNKQHHYLSRFLELGKIRIQQDASGIP
ncbi:hypothetical protein TRIATDRAFT_301921 [Trichoderma atroviride IMI 206040]|uniref:Uncharacterized protein n=1 Tax=Hypocrea atroviridis (strain ATCC 20476 / IMI 206040) TaxID=452589 RepID=G9P5E2_HYPAI|nr:uncharacterized protein TRIATDRAFT_301921 [Trichoderma atroviride IMI 206040]EHK41327.1 hypothetical protein TRIATDRAFT_301921 [Trichoderma atroviride IMI 206040]